MSLYRDSPEGNIAQTQEQWSPSSVMGLRTAQSARQHGGITWEKDESNGNGPETCIIPEARVRSLHTSIELMNSFATLNRIPHNGGDDSDGGGRDDACE